MIAGDTQTTEKEMALSAHARRVAFHQSIEAKAAELKAAKLRGSLERLPSPARAAEAIAPESMPAEPDPPKEKYWFWITGLVPGTITIAHVIEAVCREFDIEPAVLISDRRQVWICLPRQIAMWLCKDLIPERTLPAIGRKFGGRDHTTVLHACRAAPKKVAADERLAARVAKIRAELSEAQ